jgi:hypothetical protein
MGRPYRGVCRKTKAGVVGVQMERPNLGEPHYYPQQGGDFVGFKAWPVDMDGAMARPYPKPWFERAAIRITSFILGV